MTSTRLVTGTLVSLFALGAIGVAQAAPSTGDSVVTLPAGTVLRVSIDSGFGSDRSRVEDPVTATLVRAVVVNGVGVLPRGSRVRGHVVAVERPGRVKGRGRVAVRFTEVVPPNGPDRYTMRTRTWAAVAPATKRRDALSIGLPAAGGAAIGAIIGGGKGAGIGALAGGGAGTAAVLSTRGRDVRIGRGAVLAIRLAEPMRILR